MLITYVPLAWGIIAHQTVAKQTDGDPAAAIVVAKRATISSRKRLPSIKIAPPGVRSSAPEFRRSFIEVMLGHVMTA